MLEGGATHLGVATDHVIESFRNDLWDDYKTGDGIDPELFGAVPAARGRARGARASRCGRWSSSKPTTRSASAARVAAADPRVEQVIICTPDKDLGPVRRRQGRAARPAQGRCSSTPTACARSSASPPESIPDWLALVGDSADGFPGLPGFGAKTAAALLARYRPHRGDPRRRPRVGRARACAASTASPRRSPRAATSPTLLQGLATLRTDADVGTVDDWDWTAPTARFGDWCERFGRAETRSQRAAGARAKTRRIVVSDAVLVEPVGDRDHAAHAEPARAAQRDELRRSSPGSTTRSTSCADDRTCRVIVLTGAGRGFCAGLDLTEGASARRRPPGWAAPRPA